VKIGLYAGKAVRVKVLKSLNNPELMFESVSRYLLKDEQITLFILNKYPLQASFGTAGNCDVVPYSSAGKTPP
jgi:hypothetical protein